MVLVGSTRLLQWQSARRLWCRSGVLHSRFFGDESAGSEAEIHKTTDINDWLFPWRHESLDRLVPRVTPATTEYETLLAVPTPNGFLNWFFLKVPFWDAMVTQQWKPDIELGTQFALTQSVAGILSQTYRLPLDDIIVNPSSSSEAGMGLAFQHETGPLPEETTETDKEWLCPGIEDMMGRPLREKFEQSGSPWRWGGEEKKYQILLEMTPKQSYFHRFYCVPFLTRELVMQNPNVLNALFLNEKKEYQSDIGKITKFVNDNVSDQMINNDATLSTTVAVDVLVVCDEKFMVKDVETEQVRQGSDGAAKEIGHLVTLERRVDYDSSGLWPRISNITNWQITDIDDLLGAKKWFHVDKS